MALPAAVEKPTSCLRNRIETVAVAERCIGIGSNDLLLMLQPGPANWLGKARVDLDTDRADMRVQAINHLAVLLIFIEPQIQKVRAMRPLCEVPCIKA